MKTLAMVGVVWCCMLPVSHAQVAAVQMYGVLDLYLGQSRSSSSPAKTSVLNSGGMTTSYWGVGGSEPLGDGARAIFAVEGFFRADTGEVGRAAGEGMFTRNAYIGVADAWGEVRVGRQASQLFLASGQLNPFAYSMRFSPLMSRLWTPLYGGAIYGDTGWSNGLSYTSPSIAGFTLAAQVGLEEAAVNAGRNSAAALKYANDRLLLALVAHRVGNGLGVVAPIRRQTTYFAGASYDFKVSKLFLTYNRDDTQGSGRVANTVQAGASVPFGLSSVLLAWAHTREELPARPEFRRNTATLGYGYFLSKRSDVYLNFMYDKLSTASSANTLGAGLRHRF